jgi:chitinase
MTYDMRGGFQILTGHHTGLFTATGDLFRISGDASVRMYEAAGVPREKIVLGAAFYSRRWIDVPDRNHGLFQMSPGSGKHGPRYTEIERELLPAGDFTRYWDDEAKAPWLFDGSTFLSYDDEQSLGHKCAYVREHGYAGVFYWEHGCDETRALLRALGDGLHQGAP